MSDGDTLWAWQSQQQDGGWGIISMGIVSIVPPKAVVLIHRERSVVEGWRNIAAIHKAHYNEPIRLARFSFAEVVESL